MAKKELRCGRIKRSDALVNWDQPDNLRAIAIRSGLTG